METIINGIKYVDPFKSTAKLIYSTIPVEGQTIEYLSQDTLNSRYYTLSTRNPAGTYVVPIEKPNVYINFIPKKTFVTDSSIRDYIGNDFDYFVPDQPIVPELFTLPDGQIFRCTTGTSLPQDPQNYMYYIMVGEKAEEIPNYKTLEVLLAEKNQTLLSVRVLTQKQCQDITKQGVHLDKSASWKPEYEDQTTYQRLTTLVNNVKSGQAIADAAKASAQTQIDTVKAQAAADKAAADAAKAASDAAIAQAQADQAAAQQAKSQLDLQIAQLQNSGN